MYDYEVLRNQWIIFALLGGIVFVLFIIIGYLDLWKPRKRKTNSDETDTEYMGAIESIPWILKVMFIGSFVFIVLYIIFRIINPPNW